MRPQSNRKFRKPYFCNFCISWGLRRRFIDFFWLYWNNLLTFDLMYLWIVGIHFFHLFLPFLDLPEFLSQKGYLLMQLENFLFADRFSNIWSIGRSFRWFLTFILRQFTFLGFVVALFTPFFDRAVTRVDNKRSRFLLALIFKGWVFLLHVVGFNVGGL